MLADNEDFSLLNRIAVVAHATQENGPAICEALGKQGAKIVLGDVSPDAEVRRLSKLGIEAMGIATEVNQVSRLENLLAQAVQRYGRIDIMVNNTALNDPQPAENMPFEKFTQEVSATVNSVFFGCQAAARYMLEQEPSPAGPFSSKGVIVNMASVAGEMAIAGHAAYCSAMAGVIAVTKSLAAEWGPQGVRVVAVGVGLSKSLLEKLGVDTLSNVASTLPAETYMTLKSNAPPGYIPFRRPLSPADVGQAVAYLAGDAAGYTTGTTLYTDGGWLAYGYL